MQADWEPSCSLEHLQMRARMLARIRTFFFDRGVLEVETPLLSHGVGTDIHVDFFVTQYSGSPRGRDLYLQTSPEFAMKRLLAAGSGSIFQICKAFRNGESGKYHNPEFTLLEWYRVGYCITRLMDELEELLAALLNSVLSLGNSQRISYQEIFHFYTGLDALDYSLSDYLACARVNQLHDAEAICGDEQSTWLDFLFSHLVQPYLGRQGLCFVYDYPACLPSLARFKEGNRQIVERVEVFLDGVELGNGYNELLHSDEQRRRFDNELKIRADRGLPNAAIDERFLSALTAGLPDCSGMAVGLDRILMLLSASSEIAKVLSFPIDRA